MGSTFSRTEDDCGLCRQVMSTSGTRQRYSPGCCAKWYHQECLTNLVNGGGSVCPHCRTPLPPNILSTIPAAGVVYAQAVPVQNQAPQQTNLRSSISTSTSSRLPTTLRSEEAVSPWTPPSAGALQSIMDQSNIKIECTPEVQEISVDGNKKFHVLVTMSCLESEAAVMASATPSAPTENIVKNESGAPTTVATPTASPSSTRPPLDVICVLDTSGSMSSDNKLKNLIFAVDYIRGELNEFDRMAVITFENSSVVIHNLLRMNDQNKTYTASLCSGMRPGGGTSILSGLQSALDIIRGRQSQNPITSVFLLTDGVDGSHVSQKKSVSQGIKESGASLFVYGFGSDHDSKHLKMIADAATGTFTYIEKSDMVIDAFGGALGAEQSIFATNICLTITAAGPSVDNDSKPSADANANANGGVIITAAESGSYRNEVHPSGSSTKVYFNNIMLGEERDVLVSLALSPSSSISRFDQTLLHTSVSYTPVGSREICTHAGSECILSRVPSNELTNASTQRNERVDVQINRMLLVEATKESLKLADRGEYEQATQVVESTMRTIGESSSMANQNMKTKAFVDELGSTLSNVRNRDVYQTKGGRAVLSQQNQDYGMQRQAYAREGFEGVYQNKVSKASQARANTSKSTWY